MKVHLLEYPVEDLDRFVDTLAMDAIVYEWFKVYIKRASPWMSRRRVARMQDTVRLMKRKQRGE